MGMRKVALMLIFCLVGFSGRASGAEVAKIGIVDFQKVIDESNVGKRSAAQIKAQGKKMEQILKEKEAELQEIGAEGFGHEPRIARGKRTPTANQDQRSQVLEEALHG